ncbi:peptidase inhibitor family I36 protein [Streptomyces sp. NPDC026672]|uniref:peptidase inhibitor family I36 protein n=1 Tax=unclassified Streptomyces TaxID=2593676 RepID=UPI0033D7EBE0
MLRRRLAAAAFTAATTFTGLFLATTPASAMIPVEPTGNTIPVPAPSPFPSTCSSGQVCLYYNSNFSGGIYPQTHNISDYANCRFGASSVTGTAGFGQSIKNNVASVANDTSYTFYLFYNSNFAGSWIGIPAHRAVNLPSSIKNENASGGNAHYPYPSSGTGC